MQTAECRPVDRQRYNLRTKKLQTMTADHSIKCRLQFADETGVEVVNDRPVVQCFFPPATACDLVGLLLLLFGLIWL